MVSLSPRYVVVNATDRAVEVQQAGLGGNVEPLRVGYHVFVQPPQENKHTAGIYTFTLSD